VLCFFFQAFAGGSKSGVLIVTSDEAAIFVQNGRHAFTREEALANVVYGPVTVLFVRSNATTPLMCSLCSGYTRLHCNIGFTFVLARTWAEL
jgi:hypothetical protein